MHNASPGLERSIVMEKPSKMVTIRNRMQLNNFNRIHVDQGINGQTEKSKILASNQQDLRL